MDIVWRVSQKTILNFMDFAKTMCSFLLLIIWLLIETELVSEEQMMIQLLGIAA